MKRAIVTGATGFVGTNLVRHLLKDGHELHLLVRPNHTRWRIQEIYDDVYLHEVNLEDTERVTQVVASIRPDWVFHLAAYGAYPSQTNLHRIFRTNLIGTINLVEACLETGFEAFVNTGSSSEYGFKDHAPLEREWLEPNSHYAVSKASATLFCRFTAQSRGVHIPTLRLYSVYGPYEEPTRLIPTLIRYGLEGKLPSLVNPDTARDFVYVDDVNIAYLLAATQPNQELGAVYNVGTGVQTTLRQVVKLAQQVMKISIEPAWSSMPNRQWDTNTWIANNQKIREQLGWQPRHSFKEGFQSTVEWFQNSPTYNQCQIDTV